MTQFEEVPDWKQDSALAPVPAAAGVFRVEFAQGLPYIGRTADLRRRLRRLLRPAGGTSTRLTLREIASSVHYRRTGSSFESDLVLYSTAKLYRAHDCREYLKLRPACFVKVLLGNRFPRTCLTHRISRGRALFYGPFRNRNAAEHFQNAFLDLFLVRRCVENLSPSPSHPGCIWGEMALCLRPCQAVCDDEGYSREVQRMALFLKTDGASLLREIEQARDSASAALDFEAAARHHKFLAKTKGTLRLRDSLSREMSAQCGMVVQRSAAQSCLELTASTKALYRLRCGCATTARLQLRLRWVRRSAAPSPGKHGRKARPSEKEEHLALLQRWHSSSFRTGEFVPFADMSVLPIRKLAHAALRVVRDQKRAP